MLKGSCLCGAIEFEFEDIPGTVLNCHCSLCRRSHGAAFATQAFAKRHTLKFIRGEDVIKEYRSTKGIRAFCSNCGSRLINYSPDGGSYLSVAVSCIDADYAGKPTAHVFVASKAAWYEPSKDIPQYLRFAPLPTRSADVTG